MRVRHVTSTFRLHGENRRCPEESRGAIARSPTPAGAPLGLRPFPDITVRASDTHACGHPRRLHKDDGSYIGDDGAPIIQIGDRCHLLRDGLPTSHTCIYAWNIYTSSPHLLRAPLGVGVGLPALLNAPRELLSAMQQDRKRESSRLSEEAYIFKQF